MYEAGLLDSFQVIDLVAELEEAFDIEIVPELVILEHFSTPAAIIQLMKQLL